MTSNEWHKTIYYESPFGVMGITVTKRGVSELRFYQEKNQKVVSAKKQKSATGLHQQAYQQLCEYFKGERKNFDLPLDLSAGTEFMQSVWRLLADIPYGELITYKIIAEQINHPKAYRAVGLANNKNPIPIICACHRVIGSNGSLVGYAYGLEMKEALLSLENIDYRKSKKQ